MIRNILSIILVWTWLTTASLATGVYPNIAATAISSDVAATSHVITLPSGIVAGDLLLVGIALSNSSVTVTTPTGWTLLASTSTGTAAQNLVIFEKTAAGTEGTSLTVANATSNSINAASWRISAGTWDYGALPQVTAASLGAATTVTAPALSPTWGIGDTLWIVIASGGKLGAGVGSYPTNFSLAQISSCVANGTAIPCLGSAARQDTVATETPAALTFNGTAGNTVGYQVAVKAQQVYPVNIPMIGM